MIDRGLERLDIEEKHVLDVVLGGLVSFESGQRLVNVFLKEGKKDNFWTISRKPLSQNQTCAQGPRNTLTQ